MDTSPLGTAPSLVPRLCVLMWPIALLHNGLSLYRCAPFVGSLVSGHVVVRGMSLPSYDGASAVGEGFVWSLLSLRMLGRSLLVFLSRVDQLVSSRDVCLHVAEDGR